MNDWEKLKKLHYQKKNNFIVTYGNITDSDHNLAKIIRNNFEIKKLGKYHGLYLKSDTLLAWQISLARPLKKTKVKLELLIDIEMLLMVKKELQKLCAKANNKYVKDYDKI